MVLKQSAVDRVVVLELEGRVDTHSVQHLRSRLRAIMQVDSIQAIQFVIDLTHVDFIDSSGLAAFVFAMKKCRNRGGDLFLCCPQQRVRMVLEMTRLDKAIHVFPTQKQAISAFSIMSSK